MYFTESISIPNYLCDCHDRLTMWGLARLLQEAAGHHAEMADLGFRQLIDKGKAWVLCRMYFVVDRMPKEGEKVTVRTWSRGTDGLFAFRDFELIDPQGVAVTCSTYWVIIDFESRKAMRIHEFWNDIESHPDCATDRDHLDRLRLPRDGGVPHKAAQFAVRPSMLDHTFHVNNAEYIKWAFDYLPQAAPQEAPYRFAIEFLSETMPDETVTVQVYAPGGEGGSTFFKISNPRTAAVLAALMPR
jgi:acyl-ACP thioesterase